MPQNINVAGSTAAPHINLANVVLDVFSQEILFNAQPKLRFESIVQRRTELGKMPGNKITMLKYASLGGTSLLDEKVAIDTDTLTTSVIDITVNEHGKGVGMSEFLLRSSITDVLRDAAIILGQHYATNRDGLIRDALMSGPNVLYAKNRASRAGLVATDTFDVDLIREIVEFLATNKAPKFDLDAYVTFVHPHQSKSLRRDTAWVNANLYSTVENIKSGEIGRIEDMRFIETTNIHLIPVTTQDIFADNVDTGVNTVVAANANTDVYRSVTVGDYAIGLAESLPVEMRDNGVEDFGRTHKLAYYGIWGAGRIEDAHSVISETA